MDEGVDSGVDMDDGYPSLARTSCEGEKENRRKRWEREDREEHVRSRGGGGDDAVSTRMANGPNDTNNATQRDERTNDMPRRNHQS